MSVKELMQRIASGEPVEPDTMLMALARAVVQLQDVIGVEELAEPDPDNAQAEGDEATDPPMGND
jgi:hypothetical protein